ncbi:MAG TPA: MFS transporter [Candidatus Dormibacteraeota bacterium]|jgi:MFS family permease|nr:MFS transporter [Candidatus Dormibacteraeota bacterium]
MTTHASKDVVSARLPTSYKVWLAGAMGSQLGDAALYFALGWAASAHGGSAAGLVLSAIALPRTVLLLVGGAVGDRLGARPVMIMGDAVMLFVSAALGVSVWRWGTPVVLLVAAALVIGAVDAFYLPSSGSMPRRLVADDLVPRALALRQTGSQIITLVGGPLGGVLVAVAGLAAAALTDSVTFAMVLVVLITIRPGFDVSATGHRRNILREAFDGLRVAMTTAGLRPALLLVGGAAGFILPVTSILLPLLARSHGWGAGAAGLAVGALAVGTLSVTVIVARTGLRPRPATTALCGLLVTAAGETALALSPNVGAAVAGALAMGAGTGIFTTHLGPMLLTAAPPSHLSRIQSLLSLVQSSALLVSNNALGNLTRLIQPGPTILVCAGLLVGCDVMGFCAPSLRAATRPRSRTQ